MLGLEKLEIARNTLEAHLGLKVSSITMNELLLRVRIVITDGNVVAIYFNDHDQYSYSILFSRSELDRARFDNFDKNWKVRTAPHHFHARNREHAIESPMRGNPSNDMMLICEMINRSELFNADFAPGEGVG